MQYRLKCMFKNKLLNILQKLRNVFTKLSKKINKIINS